MGISAETGREALARRSVDLDVPMAHDIQQADRQGVRCPSCVRAVEFGHRRGVAGRKEPTSVKNTPKAGTCIERLRNVFSDAFWL